MLTDHMLSVYLWADTAKKTPCRAFSWKSDPENRFLVGSAEISGVLHTSEPRDADQSLINL